MNMSAQNQRAWSAIDVKAFEDDQRIISGTASVPVVDRAGDVVVAEGISIATSPTPLLLGHDSMQPVGLVYFDPPTSKGLKFRAVIPRIIEPGRLKDQTDYAYSAAKHGILSAVSIGFRALKTEPIDTGWKFVRTEILELSLVAVGACPGAVVEHIRSFGTRCGTVKVGKPGVVGLHAGSAEHSGHVVSLNGSSKTKGTVRIGQPPTTVVGLSGYSYESKLGRYGLEVSKLRGER